MRAHTLTAPPHTDAEERNRPMAAVFRCVDDGGSGMGDAKMLGDRGDRDSSLLLPHDRLVAIKNGLT
jgi:hypothetical protein